MADVLEWLAGRDPSELANGTIGFVAPVGFWLIAAVTAGLVGFVWFGYHRLLEREETRGRPLLIVLRSATLVLLFLALLEPVVTTRTVIPRESYYAVVVDDSQSMAIEDSGRDSRAGAVREGLFGEGGVVEELARDFKPRVYGAAGATRRIRGDADLTTEGIHTNLLQAIEHPVEELKAQPLSGLLLVSDGADNFQRPEELLSYAKTLGVRGIPVHTLGVGREQIDRDLRVQSVAVEKTLEEKDTFKVDVAVGNEGFGGRDVDLIVEHAGRRVKTSGVRLGESGATTRYSMELEVDEKALLEYRVRIPVGDGEAIPQNNIRTFLVDNREQEKADVLYVEGYPRNEYKFIQRALRGDESIRVAGYLQIGPQKFLRQNLSSPLELADGFPTDSEALYEYEALILGEVPRSLFTDEQLALIETFVSERGGGFLYIGEIKDEFVNTPIADLLPVEMPSKRDLPMHLRGGRIKGEHATGQPFEIRVTRDGFESPLLRLRRDISVNQALWKGLPSLQGIAVMGAPKLGATVLASHPTLRFQDQYLPVMAIERYGKGRTMVVTSGSTWRWQMMAPLSDQSHEMFWRRLLRWLTMASPPQVELDVADRHYQAEDEVEIFVRVADEFYRPNDSAEVSLVVVDPEQREVDVPVRWESQHEGMYRGVFVPSTTGIHRVQAITVGKTGTEQRASVGLLVSAATKEFEEGGADLELLKTISDASGGAFYTVDTMGSIPGDMAANPGTYSKEESRSIWDTPLALMLLLMLLCSEWAYRRLRGLS